MNITIGEAFARRKLKVRRDGKGYVAGQGKVSKLGDEDAIVSYVDIDGSVTVILCELRNGEWFHRGFIMVATPTSVFVRNPRRQTSLGEMTAALLYEAYNPKEKPPPPSDKAEGEAQPTGPGE